MTIAIRSVAFSVLFVVTTANYYNLMDGTNGIAGITGIVAFVMLAGEGWVRGERPEWILVALAIAAACGGFLPWNFPRARVFMGDVGSVLLGFMFAVLAVSWSRNLADLLMFAAFLFPFYADELVTLWARTRSGDPLMKAHRRHVYQILVNQMGHPHWRVSVSYGVLQCCVAIAAAAVRPSGWMAEVALLGTLFVAFCGFAAWVRRHE